MDWPAYAADGGSTRFSPAAVITPANVAGLAPAWEWHTGEDDRRDSATGVPIRAGDFEATPLVIADTLWIITPLNQVAALDARTGRELWRFDPDVARHGPSSDDRGVFVHRGVATWRGPRGRRILVPSRWWLISLNAATGAPDTAFGTAGRVDLTAGLSWTADRRYYGNSSPPVVWRNIVIVGSSISDRATYDGDPPGDVQAFDAATGAALWRWSPMPARDDPARASWGSAAAARIGHMNVWAPFSVDTARGLVYLPVSTPSNDWYGGRRPGDNLYAESIVCLDAATGRRVWHRQLVHHGLWDYDPAAPPVLATVTRDGHPLDVVLVAGKTGFLYGFNRLTGEPLWPMPERPVPASDVPGEAASPTQPFPISPAPFARQGFDTSDVVDFTPEIRAAAMRRIAGRRLGPLFTPPSREGTVVSPGWIGGAGWGATALDPDRQLLFVKATNQPVLIQLIAGGPEAPWRLDSSELVAPVTRLRVALPPWRTWWLRRMPGASIPVGKPPYGTLTAIDLATGAHRWTITVGDIRAIREHPQLRRVRLPPLGVPGAPGPLATASGLLFLTGGGSTIFAIDAGTGAVLWSWELGRLGYSNPATYVTGDGRQFVVIATGSGPGARLVAFALEED